MAVHACHCYRAITMCCIVNITLIYMCLYGVYCIIGCVLWVTSGAASIWHDKTDDETHCPMVLTLCHFLQMVKTWVASGFRLSRSEVGRWPLFQLSHIVFTGSSAADLQACLSITDHLPMVITVRLGSFLTCGWCRWELWRLCWVVVSMVHTTWWTITSGLVPGYVCTCLQDITDRHWRVALQLPCCCLLDACPLPWKTGWVSCSMTMGVLSRVGLLVGTWHPVAQGSWHGCCCSPKACETLVIGTKVNDLLIAPHVCVCHAAIDCSADVATVWCLDHCLWTLAWWVPTILWCLMMYFDPANLHRPAVSHCQAKRELTFTCYSLLLDFVLELVLAVQPSKMRNFRSSSEDLAVSVCHSLFTRQGGQPRDVVCLGSPPLLAPRTPLNREGHWCCDFARAGFRQNLGRLLLFGDGVWIDASSPSSLWDVASAWSVNSMAIPVINPIIHPM